MVTEFWFKPQTVPRYYTHRLYLFGKMVE